MGVAFVVFRLSPEGPEDADRIEASIKGFKLEPGVEIKDLKKEPVGFGISVVKVGFTFDDKKCIGMDEKLDSMLKTIEGVQNVEVVMNTLL